MKRYYYIFASLIFVTKLYAAQLNVIVKAPTANSYDVKVDKVYFETTGGDKFYLNVILENESDVKLNIFTASNFAYAIINKNQVKFEQTESYDKYPGDVLPGAQHIYRYVLPITFENNIQFEVKFNGNVYLSKIPLYQLTPKPISIEFIDGSWKLKGQKSDTSVKYTTRNSIKQKLELSDSYEGVSLGTSIEDAKSILGAQYSYSSPLERIGKTKIEKKYFKTLSWVMGSITKKFEEPVYNVMYYFWNNKVLMIYVCYAESIKKVPFSELLNKMSKQYGQYHYTYRVDNLNDDYQKWGFKCTAYGWEDSKTVIELEHLTTPEGGKEYLLVKYSKPILKEFLNDLKETNSREQQDKYKKTKESFDKINFGD